MTSRRQLQKRLDTALRALSQIECIADVALERHQGDSDLHWILDGIGDLAHYALEVAGDPPRRDPEAAAADAEPLDEEEAEFPAVAGDPADGSDADEDERRNH
ncbi:MAG: hypothetical protein GYA57_05065 [Myxococcales bacterium]|nr:hypothetical protein [Myxococcales bacterium]